MTFTINKLELDKNCAIIGMQVWTKIANNDRLSTVEMKVPASEMADYQLGQEFELVRK